VRDERSVKVRVQVVVEVETGTWSTDTTMAQIEKQSVEEALGRVGQLINPPKLIEPRPATDVRVVEVKALEAFMVRR
jgi:hypothetical protein